MRIELTSGVHLNLIQTNQFKTTRISVQFVAPLAQATVTKRTLLTSLLETNSQDYPTQAQLSAHLENMFGASFGIGVAREGRLHRVSATLNLIADRFSDTTLMADGFGFLARILLRPNIREGAFDQATFERERENLADYLASLDDDRQTQAALGLQQLYFASDPDQATPSFGRREDLLTLDAQQMATYYEQMIQEDQIEITVLGQFEEADVIRLAKQFAFTPRAELNQLATYDHEIGEQRSETVQANVNQAKLNFGYHVAIDDFGPAYYAAIVTESLFGGSPLSLLFTNVREKESLAYYASSQLDALRHFMLVQTGIDADSVARVTELVEAQRQN
nr:insulinase family protein [Lacticaseibacillus saniviri]